MGSKNKPGAFDCYANALPDEPMFILLARDPSAPALVKWWAEYREDAIDRGDRPESDRAMVEEARQCAKNMTEWRAANDGKWRKETKPRKPMFVGKPGCCYHDVPITQICDSCAESYGSARPTSL